MNQQLKAELADPGTRQQALNELGQWAKDTCLLFGSEASTAYNVAATLVQGIQDSWEPRGNSRILRRGRRKE
jgi:hypothetical protein